MITHRHREESDRILSTWNEENRIRASQKWVVTSPSFCFIAERKEDLEDIMDNKPPYEKLNAEYRYPARDEDFYRFWRANYDDVMKIKPLYIRILREIFS